MEGVLKSVFGFDSFRPGQKEAVTAISEGRDVLCLFPTGAGKSICYQLPALLKDRGYAIIISPLLALMHDQIVALQSKGVECAVLSSTITDLERNKLLVQLVLGTSTLKLVYMSPEQLINPEVSGVLRKATGNILYVAIDEAHCISSWGHDFRLAYRKLFMVRSIVGEDIPILACTATATSQVRDDIVELLQFKDPLILEQSFNRPNLRYHVKFKSGDEALDVRKLRDTIKRFKATTCGIIYCATRAACENLAKYLKADNIAIEAYHAGMSDKVRKAIQNRWLNSETMVLAATVAFGMGIDKPDVRYVIHFGHSMSVEGYYQESGRAGRDGKPSECFVYFSEKDYGFACWLAGRGNRGDSALYQRKVDNIMKMKQFCLLAGCRRQYLLSYFEDEYTSRTDEEKDRCCDFCKNPEKVIKELTEYQLSSLKQQKHTDYSKDFKEDEDVADFSFAFEDRGESCPVRAEVKEFSRKRPFQLKEDEEVIKVRKGSIKARILEKLTNLGKNKNR